MRAVLRLAILVGLALWAWRTLAGGRERHERAGVSYEDGSAIVLEPGSVSFERLAAVARTAIRR